MKAAGIDHYGDSVRPMTISEPRRLEPDELLLQVHTAGVGNWDNIARTGGWDLGIAPPMALGVEAAGTVLAVGSSVQRASVGDALITHPVPLRDQGTWAERVIVAENTVARKPAWMPWPEAGAFPVPGLTAYQTVVSALHVERGEWLLVHGAGGVTGSLIVTVAAALGARVIATASPDATQRTLDAGAMHVVDYHHADWPRTVRAFTAQQGVAAAANAVPGQASVALQTVHAGGRLATITSDPPPERDGITVSNVYVRADGEQLQVSQPCSSSGRLGFVLPAAMSWSKQRRPCPRSWRAACEEPRFLSRNGEGRGSDQIVHRHNGADLKNEGRAEA